MMGNFYNMEAAVLFPTISSDSERGIPTIDQNPPVLSNKIQAALEKSNTAQLFFSTSSKPLIKCGHTRLLLYKLRRALPLNYSFSYNPRRHFIVKIGTEPTPINAGGVPQVKCMGPTFIPAVYSRPPNITGVLTAMFQSDDVKYLGLAPS
jgi:hypothetical protein